MAELGERLLYLSCAAARRIMVFAQDRASGELHARPGITVPGTGAPALSMPLARHPRGLVLYAAERTEPYAVSSFAIDPATATLRPLALAPLPAAMAYLATDRAGRFLLAASYPHSLVSVSAIGADGGVLAPPAQVIATPARAHCILADPQNRFVHATSLGGDCLLTWPLGPHGLVESALRVTPQRPGAGPRHLAFGEQGRLVFLLNELDASIDVFGCAEGILTHRQTVAFPDMPAGQAAAADLHLSPDGRFLYASERRTNRLAWFAVAPGEGTLRPAGALPCEAHPRGFAITPDGHFLLCAGLEENRLGVYALAGETGAPTRLAQYPTEAGPNWIEIADPSA